MKKTILFMMLVASATSYALKPDARLGSWDNATRSEKIKFVENLGKKSSCVYNIDKWIKHLKNVDSFGKGSKIKVRVLVNNKC